MGQSTSCFKNICNSITGQKQSIHLKIFPVLPVRNMGQETGNFSPLDMQEIINELIAEPGSQYARSIQCLSTASISEWGIGGLSVCW